MGIITKPYTFPNGNIENGTQVNADLDVLYGAVNAALPLAGGTMSGNIVMPNGGTIGQAAGPLITFDDTNNYLVIMGTSVGIGTESPSQALDVAGRIRIDGGGTSSSFPMLMVGSISSSVGRDMFNINIDTDGLNTSLFNVKDNGNVGIGTPPNANAILDVVSTTKAFMPPRMTTTQRDAIASPTEGMVIWNKTTHVLNCYYTSWAAV